MQTFENADSLRAWLSARNIDTTLWNTGNSKSVSHLWNELENGDTVLQDRPALRLVEVVQIRIRAHESFLVEAIQEFEDGRRRTRNQLPSEKIKPGETYQEAALRCLREELHISAKNVQLISESYEKTGLEIDAKSYPGLLTRYTIHHIEAAVSGLPDGDFWRENRSFQKGDPIRRHLWVWRQDPA